MPDSPRRIAFCITELDPGGAERALVQIVTRLDPRQWTPRVYCLTGTGELAATLEEHGVGVHFLQMRSRRDLGVVGRLRAELQMFQPDVLQTFLFHANLVGRMAARRAGVPVVVSGVRVIEQDAHWRMRLDRWTNRYVTYNVCVSQSIATAYRALGVSDAKLSVIPNGVDVARFEQAVAADLSEFGIPHEARCVLAVGRLHPQKGFDLLMEAIQPVLDESPDVHLLIVGEGPQRERLERMICSSTHASRIHLAGRRSDIPELMQACDLFVLSSRWEGMPNVLLEAMATRLPAIATDVEGVRDVIEHGTSGVIAERASVPSLGAGIRKVLMEPMFAETIATTALERVRRFSWDNVAGQYSELWLGLLRSGEA